MNSNYYQILEITVNATPEEIKIAYRRMAQKYHPDKAGSGSENIFQKIQDAYSVLSDEEKRKLYDASGFDLVKIKDIEDCAKDFCQKIISYVLTSKVQEILEIKVSRRTNKSFIYPRKNGRAVAIVSLDDFNSGRGCYESSPTEELFEFVKGKAIEDIEISIAETNSVVTALEIKLKEAERICKQFVGIDFFFNTLNQTRHEVREELEKFKRNKLILERAKQMIFEIQNTTKEKLNAS